MKTTDHYIEATGIIAQHDTNTTQLHNGESPLYVQFENTYDGETLVSHARLSERDATTPHPPKGERSPLAVGDVVTVKFNKSSITEPSGSPCYIAYDVLSVNDSALPKFN